MRGKAVCNADRLRAGGITPAYAGKSKSRTQKSGAQKDHPRVCGEKAQRARGLNLILGSPPRMRGKAKALGLDEKPVGITPAYAGKSPDFIHTRTMRAGSPPRMRGKVLCSSLFHGCSRITPAYAGKRLKRSHSIGHFSCILCLFHSVLHRASVSGGSRAGPCAPPCLPAQNAVPV